MESIGDQNITLEQQIVETEALVANQPANRAETDAILAETKQVEEEIAMIQLELQQLESRQAAVNTDASESSTKI